MLIQRHCKLRTSIFRRFTCKVEKGNGQYLGRPLIYSYVSRELAHFLYNIHARAYNTINHKSTPSSHFRFTHSFLFFSFFSLLALSSLVT